MGEYTLALRLQHTLSTSCLQGTKDVIVPYKYAEKIKALIPHAQLVTVQDAGHVSDLFINHSNIVAKSLVNFLHS